MNRNRGNLLGMMTALYEKGKGNANRTDVAGRFKVNRSAPSALVELGLCKWEGSAFQWIGAKPTRATEKRVYGNLAQRQIYYKDRKLKKSADEQTLIPFKADTQKHKKVNKSRKTSKGNRVSVSIAWGLVRFEIPTTP